MGESFMEYIQFISVAVVVVIFIIEGIVYD